ncbi:MAG TPA: single-stranded DNA-binding protein [Chloroflexi bacterium]|nr:single-stranded DNA-binding protein [Chloroflexota bacterium]
MSYQKVVIVGNLGRDPDFRYLGGDSNSQAVANFNVATNRQYTASNGERVKETTWFRVTVWGRQAETCNQYLRTGSQVLVEGRMTIDRETGGPRVYERSDGTFGASFELTGERVVFLSSRGDAGDFSTSEPGMMEEDDIPF